MTFPIYTSLIVDFNIATIPVWATVKQFNVQDPNNPYVASVFVDGLHRTLQVSKVATPHHSKVYDNNDCGMYR
jgi:hypothetical protein